MKLNNQRKINTKKKALKLIYDPTSLFRLLYSKYGDIEEDYELFHINQLIYESSSHYNIIFKELEIFQDFDEYLKRWYTKYESENRMPKINDYYKNYHKFFCKPNFSDFAIGNIMQNCSDEKAELYYKENFDNLLNTDNDEDNSKKNNSMSSSSLDNITNNKIIFNEKNKFLIDEDEKSINYSMTINLNSSTINNIIKDKNKNLASTRRTNDSFEQIIHNLVNYQKKKENKNSNIKKKKINNKSIKTNNDNKKINSNNFSKKNCSKMSFVEHKIKKNKKGSKEHIIKNYNSNNLKKVKGFIGDNNNNILKSILKVFNSPKNFIKKGKFEENINPKKSAKIHHQRNKTHTINNYSGIVSFHENRINPNQNQHQNLSNNSKHLKKTTSQNKVIFNSILTLKDLQSQKIKIKNTFDSMSFFKNNINASNNIKVYNRLKSNKNIGGINSKNGNYIGSKFNLVKNAKNININFDKLRNKKQTSYNHCQNILNQIQRNKITGYKNINNNTSHSSKKNKSISPINSNKDNKIYNNYNDIKNRNKSTKNQINNYNINFNNVFLTSSKQSSYIIDNNNNNNNNNKNYNNSHIYSSINVIKNMSNNSISNNNISNNNFIYTNILENRTNKNLYVMNLKNIYNISRNKNNILINNNPLTQTESHHSKIQNNYNIINIQKNNYNINKIKEAKIFIDKNTDYSKNNNNGNNSKGKNKNKSKSKAKIINKKYSYDINNFIKKSRNKFNNIRNLKKNLDIFKTNKLLNTGDEFRKKYLKSNKSFNNCSKIAFSSSSVSRRKNKSRIKNNNENNKNNNNKINFENKKISSLTSQKNIKSKYKRKIK